MSLNHKILIVNYNNKIIYFINESSIKNYKKLKEYCLENKLDIEIISPEEFRKKEILSVTEYDKQMCFFYSELHEIITGDVEINVRFYTFLQTKFNKY
jgi:hypothetical protein